MDSILSIFHTSGFKSLTDVAREEGELAESASRFTTFLHSLQPDLISHCPNITSDPKLTFREYRLERENGQIFVTLRFEAR